MIKDSDDVVKITKSKVFLFLAIIFAVLFVISTLTNGFSGSHNFSDEEISAKVVSSINSLQAGLNPSVTSVQRLPDGMYRVAIAIQDQVLDSYVSPDGNLFFPQGVPSADYELPPVAAVNAPQAACGG